MQIFKSRVGAVVAGAAVLALATGGGAAFAEKGGNANPPGQDSAPGLHKSQPVGLSHWSEGGVVPPANKPFAEADPTDPTYMPGSIEVVAECQQEGHVAIAGGYTAGTYKGGVTTYQNRNTAGAPGTDEYGAGWIVGFTNMTDEPQKVRTWVVCAEMAEDQPSE